jgi:PAS domain-containing protein
VKSKKEKEDLRARAEALIAGRSPGAPADTRTYNEVLHELLVYEIELEMQNEELGKAGDVIEESRTRCADLYEAAPVAYLIFDENGRVLEANLTARALLGDDDRHPYEGPERVRTDPRRPYPDSAGPQQPLHQCRSGHARKRRDPRYRAERSHRFARRLDHVPNDGY